jgi:hypothetical protein
MATAIRPHAELRIPADPRLLRIARVTAAALGVELAFTVQDVEDLRVAVDELAAAAIEGCDPDQILELTFQVNDQDLEVSGRVAGAGAPIALHPVASDLLGLVADRHELAQDGDDRVFSFSKRAGASAP